MKLPVLWHPSAWTFAKHWQARASLFTSSQLHLLPGHQGQGKGCAHGEEEGEPLNSEEECQEAGGIPPQETAIFVNCETSSRKGS